jgi:putative ABC transport system substrate-binding protein
MHFDRLKRREFITLLGGVTAAWSLAAGAQQPKVPVVGFMHTLSPERVPHLVAAFRQGLKEVGYTEGQDLTVEYRWAQGHYDRLPELAADLVRRQVAVIAATGGDPSPQIAKAATQTIPIVFTANGDPIRQGLVASLNRPGGNATGFTIFGPAAVTKRLQLLHELVPHVAAIAYLMNPDNPNGEVEMQAAEAAARPLGLQVFAFKASSEAELDSAFPAMLRQRAGAILVASDGFFWGRREQVVSLAARYQIPAM